MAKSSVSLRNRLWDRLIQGLCANKKDPEKAFLVLQDCLSVDGTLPSSFTFCTLIHSFSSKGMMSGAIEVLEMMTEEKTKYPLDNFVCSSLISGFCRIGKPELAVEFFENAESSGGLRPNCVTYTALVNAYCRLGRFVEVSSLVTRMEKEGINFDVVLYSSLIHGYFIEGDLLGALRKHREMVDKQNRLGYRWLYYTCRWIFKGSKRGEIVGVFKQNEKGWISTQFGCLYSGHVGILQNRETGGGFCGA